MFWCNSIWDSENEQKSSNSITKSSDETADKGNEAKSEAIIRLTDHTIMNYNIRFDDMGTNDEYLSGEICGIELTGIFEH